MRSWLRRRSRIPAWLGASGDRLVERLSAPGRLDPGDRHPFDRWVVRPRATMTARIAAVVSGVVCVVGVLLLTPVADSDPDLVLPPLVVVMFLGWVAVRAARHGWRRSLVVDREGLRMTDGMRTRTLIWPAIRDAQIRPCNPDVSYSWYGLAVLVDGREVRLPFPVASRAAHLEPLRMLVLRGRDLARAETGHPRDVIQD